MEITFYGHSCFNIKIGKCNLLFDPFITGNPMAIGINVKDLKADYILVSHAHSDHIGDTLEIAERNSSVLIANYEVNEWFAEKGLKGGQGINHGGKIKTDFGSVRYVNAVHSSRFSDGKYGGTPGGFVVESAEGNFYFAGDTALTMDMKLIPMYCNLKFAILPIGGYFTMDYHDALLASNFIECNKIIGMHYDSFPTIKIDHTDAQQVFSVKGKELLLMKTGEVIVI